MLLNALLFFLIGLENLLDRKAERKVGYLFLSVSFVVLVTTLGSMWGGHERTQASGRLSYRLKVKATTSPDKAKRPIKTKQIIQLIF